MKSPLSIILITIFLLCSCQKSKEDKEGTTASLSFQVERNAFFNSLKTPAEAAEKLKVTSVGFNASLMSDPTHFIAYANNPVKAAANLGIYLSDLNYSIAYQQAAHTKELFTAAYELSKIMGIEKGILDFLMKRYSDNLAQNDSARSVVNALFDTSTRGLQGTNRERLVGIAMAAYQIENLHLALGVIASYPKDKQLENEHSQNLAPVFQMVLDQKSSIEIIYGFLRSITDVADPNRNPNYPFYANAFKELIDVYHRLNIEEKIAANQRTELMNDIVVKELNERVNAIRVKIISAE